MSCVPISVAFWWRFSVHHLQANLLQSANDFETGVNLLNTQSMRQPLSHATRLFKHTRMLSVSLQKQV